MLQVRSSASRGHLQHGWLDTYHTFSFGDYQDPQFMGFLALRVMNEDWVAPGQGFGMHGHRDMEIVTYVLEGELQHADSMGNGAVLKPGEFQRITAGTGIRHSEFNPQNDQPVHLYQIWLTPAVNGTKPGYEQKTFAELPKFGDFWLAASPDGRDGSLSIGQDALILLGRLEMNASATYVMQAGRHAWLQILRGGVELNGVSLSAGDGVAISEEAAIQIKASATAELMLFDLP